MSTTTVWNSYEAEPHSSEEQGGSGERPENTVVQYGTPKDRAPAPSLDFAPMVTVDEFQALEQKVLSAVAIVRREREARAAAEAEVVALREQLAALTHASNEAQTQITSLHQERESVRVRVERLLRQMDELL